MYSIKQREERKGAKRFKSISRIGHLGNNKMANLKLTISIIIVN